MYDVLNAEVWYVDFGLRISVKMSESDVYMLVHFCMYTSSQVFQTRDPAQEHQNTVGDGGGGGGG